MASPVSPSYLANRSNVSSPLFCYCKVIAINPDRPLPQKVEAEKYLTPLVIGVAGHRDLVPSEVEALLKLITQLFDDLRSRFPNTPLRLMTALASSTKMVPRGGIVDI